MYDEQSWTNKPDDEQAQAQAHFGMNTGVKGCVYNCTDRML